LHKVVLLFYSEFSTIHASPHVLEDMRFTSLENYRILVVSMAVIIMT
jgi:hypothetical protein